MDNNQGLYSRQRTMSLNIPSSVAVIGLGGGGSWVAIAFALAGVKRIVVIDKDTVEESNLNRTLYRYSDIGKSKTQAVKELIAERRPECEVICINDTSIASYDKLEANHGMEFLEVLGCKQVIDATDNYQTRNLFAHLYQKEKIRPKYCKLGYDGLSYEIDYTFCHIEDSNTQGYQQANTYVGTVLSEMGLLLHTSMLNLSTTGRLYQSNAVLDNNRIAKEHKDWKPPITAVIDGETFKLMPFTGETTLQGTDIYIDVDKDKPSESTTAQKTGIIDSMLGICQTRFRLPDDISGRYPNILGNSWYYEDIYIIGDKINTAPPVETVSKEDLDYEIIEEVENVELVDNLVARDMAQATEN